MAMIFPGMDPFLENPQLWTGVHSSMIVYLRDQLQPKLQPRYIATVEERVYLAGPDREIAPDAWIKRDRNEGGGGVAVLETDAPVLVEIPPEEVHETYVAVLDRDSWERVVTVIEVVSPSNKFAGPGRTSYLTKQREVLSSITHLVEIDLLRNGPHVVAAAEWAVRGRGPYDYLVSVNRAGGIRSRFELYPRGLRDRLPRVRVPLAGADPDAALDLQAVLAQTYDAGLYRKRIRYDQPCVPPLSPEDQAWADVHIRAQAGAT